MIIEALNKAPFFVYSLKIKSKSSRRFCSSREFVSVEASTIKSLASSIADSGVCWVPRVWQCCFLGPVERGGGWRFLLVPKAAILG